MCDNIQIIANQESSPELWFLKFLLGFHYLGMNDLLIYCKIKLNSGHPLVPGEWADMVWLKTPNLLIKWLVFLAWPVPILSQLITTHQVGTSY